MRPWPWDIKAISLVPWASARGAASCWFGPVDLLRVGAVLFGPPGAGFLNDSPKRSSVFQIVARHTFTPCSATNHSRNSAIVASGCLALCPRIAAQSRNRRCCARVAELVAIQVVEDEGPRRRRRADRSSIHYYNGVLKRVMGCSRAEMTLSEIDATIAWLERKRVADHTVAI